MLITDLNIIYLCYLAESAYWSIQGASHFEFYVDEFPSAYWLKMRIMGIVANGSTQMDSHRLVNPLPKCPIK